MQSIAITFLGLALTEASLHEEGGMPGKPFKMMLTQILVSDTVQGRV